MNGALSRLQAAGNARFLQSLHGGRCACDICIVRRALQRIDDEPLGDDLVDRQDPAFLVALKRAEAAHAAVQRERHERALDRAACAILRRDVR